MHIREALMHDSANIHKDHQRRHFYRALGALIDEMKRSSHILGEIVISKR
jgi:hypothetical protein